MKRFLFTIFLVTPLLAFCQVGIGTMNPKAGASLQIDGSDSGVLINRVALTGLDDILTIPGLDATYEGLMVYNTATAGVGQLAIAPGFYFWTGSVWSTIRKGGVIDKGWVALTDGDLSQSLSFVDAPLLTDFSNFVNIDMDFTGGMDNVIESYAPDGFTSSDFFDSSAGRITPIGLGDQILLRLQFDATPLQNNGVIALQIDIGANDIPGDLDDFVIFQKSIPLVRGGGRVTNVSETILLYQLGTFLANGAKIRLAYTRSNNTTGTTCVVNNFSLVISKL